MTRSAEIQTSRLRSVRESQGRSLRAVARKAKVDPAHYSRIERGLAKPGLLTATRIALVLGLEPGPLIAGLLTHDEAEALFREVSTGEDD